MAKKRLDVLLQEQLPHYSRRQIQSWIMQGRVCVDGTSITKAGTLIGPDAIITYDVQEPAYVSRAGFKLEAALKHFALDVTGLVALDAGLSTGGFTDCLLQQGVAKVYGIDVGYGQVSDKIRHDPRVIVRERTNLRALMSVGELVDIITLDLSFISVLKVMDAVVSLLKPNGKLIVLIKPQFEASKAEVGRGGLIRDEALRHDIANRVIQGISPYGFELIGMIDSPIEGATGNKEFLAYFQRRS